MNKKANVVFIILAAIFLFWSCDHGQLGGADQTDIYYNNDALFKERMGFLCGIWSSSYDGYRIRQWSDFNEVDKERARSLFPELSVNAPVTYSSDVSPQNSDYVILFDDDTAGSGWGLGFMGLVRAINIFNGDKNRGAIIIEYFEEADPQWLSDPESFAYQGLTRGEKPFSGIYYKTLSTDTIQMAAPVDLAAMYAGELYYTEKGTLQKAVETFTVENEAEFINWANAVTQEREK